VYKLYKLISDRETGKTASRRTM